MAVINTGEKLGSYIVQRTLCSGPLGDTVFAYNGEDNAEVAITIVNQSIVSNDLIYEEFKQDFDRLAKVTHPSIASVDKIHQEGDLHYFISKIPPSSKSINDVLKSGKVLELESAVSVINKIATALNSAWDQYGVIHSSLRPENLIVTPANDVCILHFGLEESIDSTLRSTVESSKNLRRYLNVNRYRCPFMSQSKDYNCRSDMYSLGVCFYEILTADEPFISSEAEIVTHLLHDESKIDNLIKRDFPIKIVELIAAMIATDPERRPKSWQEIINILETMNQSNTFRTVNAPEREIIIDSSTKPSSIFIITIVILIMAFILFLLSILMTNKLITQDRVKTFFISSHTHQSNWFSP